MPPIPIFGICQAIVALENERFYWILTRWSEPLCSRWIPDAEQGQAGSGDENKRPPKGLIRARQRNQVTREEGAESRKSRRECKPKPAQRCPQISRRRCHRDPYQEAVREERKAEPTHGIENQYEGVVARRDPQ